MTCHKVRAALNQFTQIPAHAAEHLATNAEMAFHRAGVRLTDETFDRFEFIINRDNRVIIGIKIICDGATWEWADMIDTLDIQQARKV